MKKSHLEENDKTKFKRKQMPVENCQLSIVVSEISISNKRIHSNVKSRFPSYAINVFTFRDTKILDNTTHLNEIISIYLCVCTYIYCIYTLCLYIYKYIFIYIDTVTSEKKGDFFSFVFVSL